MVWSEAQRRVMELGDGIALKTADWPRGRGVPDTQDLKTVTRIVDDLRI